MGNAERLRETFREAEFVPRRTRGQHFIVDKRFLATIVRDAEVGAGDDVVEIGCGPGGLTAALLAAGARVTAVEIDERLIRLCRESIDEKDLLKMIHEDARRLSDRAADLPPTFHVVANLPYAASTDILIDLLSLGDRIPSMTLLIQWEVYERLAARPGERDYGPLTVMVRSVYDPRLLRKVHPRIFIPPPKVRSALIRLDRVAAHPPAHCRELSAILRLLFSFRRRKLRHAIDRAFPHVDPARFDDHALLEQPVARLTPAQLLAVATLSRRLGLS